MCSRIVILASPAIWRHVLGVMWIVTLWVHGADGTSAPIGGRKDICFAPFGGSHFLVVRPLVHEVLSRGHSVSIFVAAEHEQETRELVTQDTPGNAVHYFTWEGVTTVIPKEFLRTWRTPRCLDDVWVLWGELLWNVMTEAWVPHDVPMPPLLKAAMARQCAVHFSDSTLVIASCATVVVFWL